MPFKVTDLLIDAVGAAKKKKPKKPGKGRSTPPRCNNITCSGNSCGPCTEGMTCACTVCNTLTGSPSACANPTSTRHSACSMREAYDRDLERLLAALRDATEADKAAA